MSWVQQPTAAMSAANLQPHQQQQQHLQQQPALAPVTQPQYQQQQHTHAPTSTTSAPGFLGKAALTQSPLPLSAPAKHLQNHVQPAAATLHYNTLSNVPQQQFKSHQQSSPQQQQHNPQQQQQQRTWQQHTNYQQNNNMQQTNATVNSWPQQQPNVQQQQSNYAQNVNNWPQQQPTEMQSVAAPPPQQQQQPSIYDNYFAQEKTTPQTHPPPPPSSSTQQTQPLTHQQFYQQNDLNAFNQQQQQAPAQPQQQQQYNFNEYFDNSNANSNNTNTNVNKSNDGWGDWGDWNENNVSNNDLQQNNILEHQQQQHQQPQHQSQSQYNANVIEDSFNIQNTKNDNWQWNISENVASTNPATIVPTSVQSNSAENSSAPTPQVPPKQPLIQSQPSMQQSYTVPSTQQPNTTAAALPQQQSVDFSVVTSKSATVASTVKPPNTLPLHAAEPNDNNHYNNLNVAPSSLSNQTNFPNNIPKSVYVSQAKPVTRPSRQYASPPTGNTPIDAPESSILLPSPPQAFQNDNLNASSASTTQIDPPQATMPPTVMPQLQNSGNAPPPAATAGGVNPFKRAGGVKHHRAELLSNTSTTANNFAVPPPPADFANPTSIHLQPDNSEVLHENQEVIAPPAPILQNITLPGTAPLNAERNQYMQTSQLSENQDEELNLEVDSLPPPGLSRLVLGEPELETNQRLVTGIEELEANQRLVTGTEQPSITNNTGVSMDMEERHADGEDTSVEQLPNVLPLITTASQNRSVAADITADRNLYQVPGESNVNNEQRVVTGVETNETITLSMAPSVPPSQLRSDQREIELDGENLEDQQQTSSMTVVASRNEPPLEGAAANTTTTATAPATHVEHTDLRHHNHPSKASTTKSQSNASTGNESELDHEHHHSQRYKATRNAAKHSDSDRRTEKQLQRREKQHSTERSYGSEEASEEYSSERERERRRGYREGSARSDRGNDERRETKDYQRRHEKRDKGDRDREQNRDRDRARDKYYNERRREGAANSKADRSQRTTHYNRYDAEETEESLPSGGNANNRKDYTRRSMRASGGVRPAHDDRSDRDDRYERTQRRSNREKDLDRSERRDRRGGNRRDEHDDYDTVERRRRRGEKPHSREYEEYRKQSSRNARDSDLEGKEQRHARNGTSGQLPDPRFDPRVLYGYQQSAPYGMDYYYYEHLARTNPKAYNEYYKKYYEQQLMASMGGSQQGAAAAAASTTLSESISVNATGAANSSLAATDGRESVHSGRSSAHNDKDRYTQAYISQANQYHRHYQQQKALLHYSSQHQQLQLQQQQQQQEQQHHQQRLQAVAYQKQQNLPINSTFHGDTISVASFGSYSHIGRLSAAQSVDNLSSVSSQLASLPSTAAKRNVSGYYIGHDKRSMSYASLERYADLRSGQNFQRTVETGALEQHRSTPCKFTSLHAVVSLSSGFLVTVKPKITSKGHLSNIVKLQRLGINDAARSLFQAFPGPLVRGLTHKKTIIDFCEEQIRLGPTETTIYSRQLTPKSVEKYRASYTLMWNLLILLLRQNGMVVGTDIAELLLKSQQQYPYQSGIDAVSSRRIHSVSDDGSEDSIDASGAALEQKLQTEKQEEDVVAGENIDATDDKTDSVEDSTTSLTTQHVPLTETEITEKFRNYLLYGNVNEALDWATDNNLWGHALFLASKVDRRSHANVMMKFANKLALNDPLQTLYQLMSGRTPSSVTSVQDEKWGDWRPHLSMILSNTSQKPELDRKAITTLGDSLFNRGDLYASHFCYLMAQVGFGRYQESAVHETNLQQNLPKLVLLGSSHYKNFRDFSTNEAIMMTEIYEYACSLNDEKFSLVEFQPYKYLLATRLLDYGFNLKSLMYMEQIAQHIARDPTRYEPSFINKVYEIADRLKYFDPVLEKTLDDQQLNDGSSNADTQNALPPNFEEQKWLQSLRTIAVQYKLDYPVPTASYPSHDYVQQQQDTNYLQSQINQEFAEINKQFSELNLQYTSGNTAEPAFYNPDNIQNQQQSQQQQQTTQENTDQQQQTAPLPPVQQAYTEYGNATVAGSNVATDNAHADPYANYAQQQQQPGAYYDPNTQQPYDAYGQPIVGGYNDYWANQQQPQNIVDENARPTISMPKSKSYDSDDETRKKQQQQQQQKNNANQSKKGDGQQNKSGAKDSNKNTQQNSGWFGGIFNILKPKNQMILPDDKNPSIVWDDSKKRWVNTDGDEEPESSLKPPPKMSDIMPQPSLQQIQQQQQQPQIPQISQIQQQQQQPQIPLQQQQQHQPTPLIDNNNTLQPISMPLATSSPLSNYSASAIGAANANTNSAPNAPKPPSLQSNMFKLQRNRTLKNSYVDVFNPSGAPMSKSAENVLAPTLPPTTVPQGGFFIPDSGTAGNGANVNDPTGGYQQQQETPQFYNPNQFSGSGY